MSSIRSRFVTISVILVLLAYAAGIVFAWYLREPRSPWLTGSRLMGLGLCLVLVGAFVGYTLSQTIRRRLYDIEEAAVLIAEGRLHHRIVGFGERDEIDQLASQFNRMGERIEQQVALLQKLAEENFVLAQTAERAATAEERQRVARELHDSVSQQLFSLTLLSATARSQCEKNAPQLPATIAYIEDLANQAQREMRALLLHLRPIELEGRSFSEATQEFLQAVAERHGLDWSFRAEAEHELPAAIEEQLFRILQEAVANVFKHAQATSVSVQLGEQPTHYELTVSDDGRGFSEDVAAQGDTYGISAMRERAARLGGRMEILRREVGMTLKVVIPRAEGAGD